MQIEKALINERLHVSKASWKSWSIFQKHPEKHPEIFADIFNTGEICYFLKK